MDILKFLRAPQSPSEGFKVSVGIRLAIPVILYVEEAYVPIADLHFY
jgi:hypothetical protein